MWLLLLVTQALWLVGLNHLCARLQPSSDAMGRHTLVAFCGHLSPPIPGQQAGPISQ